MAQRYGGPHSPDPQQPGTGPRGPFGGRRRSRAAARLNMMFMAALPFLLFSFQQEPVPMGLDITAFLILVLAAWLTREGIHAQEAYEARRVARRPALPRKLIAAVLTGGGLFLGGYIPGGSLLHPLIFGVLGLVLHLLAFGPDPMRDKGMEGIDPFQTERVARAVGEAETYLAGMKDAILRTNDRVLLARVEKFQTAARELFRTVEADPRDLTGARKYMGVYLMGARDATAKFADIWVATRDAQARADYEALLDDLETNFAARRRQMLLDDRSDLNIEIDVLRDRLQREGVRAE